MTFRTEDAAALRYASKKKESETYPGLTEDTLQALTIGDYSALLVMLVNGSKEQKDYARKTVRDYINAGNYK